MRDRLESLGLTKLEFHIDWLPDYKCIDIQGRRDRLFVNIQIEPAASWTRTMRDTKLRHTPISKIL